MNYLTGIMATTHVNRRRERFTRESLEGAAAAANEKGGIPQLVNHDWSRVIGWSERLWVEPMEDGEYALRTEATMPETREEERTLYERFHRYVEETQKEKVEPYADAIASLQRPSAAAVFSLDCVGLVELALARVLCGDVVAPDESGLMPISRLKPVAGGLFCHGKYLLAPHWMMRRYAYRLNSLNDTFIGTLKRLDDETDLSCRIRIDEDFVGLRESLTMYGECDYWWGKPFTGDLLTQPEGVLCHGADDRFRVLEMLDRVEMYLYRRDGETVIQIEEIHSTPLIRPFEGEQYAVERYAHMILNAQGAVIHLDGAMRLYSAEAWHERQKPTVNIANAPRARHRLKMFAVHGVTNQETALSVIRGYFRGNPLVPEAFGVSMFDGENATRHESPRPRPPAVPKA